MVVYRNAGQVREGIPSGQETDQVRHVTVGRELRPLCTEHPKKHTPLPTDSEAWDQGVRMSTANLNITDLF